MEYNNRLNRSLVAVKKAPSFLQNWLRDRAIGKFVKFVGTANIHFEKMTCHEVVLTLANATKVQNHIGQIHAAATTLLAETATGMIVGMNLPDDKLPLMKTLTVHFIKRSQGAQRAVATLSDDQIAQLRNTERGDMIVPVAIHDEAGTEVVKADMCWAWILKK
jgi:acyl-coenzyme A thioesterase PaaI-like protein